MYTNPSPVDLLEGVLVALQTDILPSVNNEKAQVVTVMMQAVVQQVRQLIPVYLQTLATEHNQMVRVFRDMAAIIGESAGPEADRMRERGTTLGTKDTYEPMPAMEDVMAAHRALSEALVDSVRDLDVMATNGSEAAEQALQRMRAHLGPRGVTDFSTYVVGAGMAGRG